MKEPCIPMTVLPASLVQWAIVLSGVCLSSSDVIMTPAENQLWSTSQINIGGQDVPITKSPHSWSPPERLPKLQMSYWEESEIEVDDNETSVTNIPKTAEVYQYEGNSHLSVGVAAAIAVGVSFPVGVVLGVLVTIVCCKCKKRATPSTPCRHMKRRSTYARTEIRGIPHILASTGSLSPSHLGLSGTGKHEGDVCGHHECSPTRCTHSSTLNQNMAKRNQNETTDINVEVGRASSDPDYHPYLDLIGSQVEKNTIFYAYTNVAETESACAHVHECDEDEYDTCAYEIIEPSSLQCECTDHNEDYNGAHQMAPRETEGIFKTKIHFELSC
ncbi:uncharacterized protein LOC106176176 [Lingula anatina]|uniref:Uncharacterized protein LOC106176176 n=1 Tax=Lingula anatina TaxID=7574 RepID=A0A1S3JUX3_LINAN|nr:uncharacterized protein LOC106176176 [Lingula anatina]|eukprot:XP_013413889.1 uncharacterized protein LOC106176176 [Lingula anatina]